MIGLNKLQCCKLHFLKNIVQSEYIIYLNIVEVGGKSQYVYTVYLGLFISSRFWHLF